MLQPMPAKSSISFTQAFGGVPGVDQIIRIRSGPGDDVEGVTSALATGGAKNPFEGDGEKDNFCFSPSAKACLVYQLTLPFPTAGSTTKTFPTAAN